MPYLEAGAALQANELDARGRAPGRINAMPPLDPSTDYIIAGIVDGRRDAYIKPLAAGWTPDRSEAGVFPSTAADAFLQAVPLHVDSLEAIPQVQPGEQHDPRL